MSTPSHQAAPQTSGPQEGLHTNPRDGFYTEEETMKRIQAKVTKADNLSKTEKERRLGEYAKTTVNWKEHDRMGLRFITKGPGKPPREIAAITYRDLKTATAIAKGVEATARETSTTLDFGAIKQKGRQQALETTIEHLGKTGEEATVLQMDIQEFYPTIPHGIYREGQFGTRQWTFIQEMLKAYGRVKGVSNRGIPQGSPISPLLASIALTTILGNLRKDAGLSTVITYADDITILDKDMENAMTTFKRIHTALRKRGMSLHPEKLGFTKWTKGASFELLGYALTNTEEGIQVSCPEGKFQKMKDNIPHHDEKKARHYLQGWNSELLPTTNPHQKEELNRLLSNLRRSRASSEVLRPGIPGAPTPM